MEKLSRSQPVAGLELLEVDAVVDAFKKAFDGQIEIESDAGKRITAIHGWLFSVLISEPLGSIWVNCSWAVTKHPEVVDKLLYTGYELRGCNAYNPQVDEFAANRGAVK